jgi:glycosyltransferase involved in cell wall biosynthesis
MQQVGANANYFPDLSMFSGEAAGPVARPLQDALHWISELRSAHCNVIGLNFCEHSFRSFSDHHDDSERRKFVSDVINRLFGAIPRAHCVLISNDSRHWDNFPSDATYQQWAKQEIDRSFGPDRSFVLDPSLSYSDNMAVMGGFDLIVTGRMHLAHAAVRQNTLPLMLMGSGKGYSSLAKMLGMSETVLRTRKCVISKIDSIAPAVRWALQSRDELQAALRQWNNRSRTEEALLLPSLTRALGLPTPAPDAMELILQENWRRLAEVDALLDDRELQLQNAAGDAARARSQFLELRSESDRIVEELYRTYRRPLRPLKRGVQRLLLKFALVLRFLLSKRRVESLRQSLAKRKPRRIREHWAATVNRIAESLPTNLAPSVPASAPSATSANRAVRRFFVMDWRIPKPDVSAGERATWGLITNLRDLGFEVVFCPADLETADPYVSRLEKLGVTVITRRSGTKKVTDYLRANGAGFDAFYLIRYRVAEKILPTVREAAPTARVVFHDPDLHFLRELREAELSGSRRALAAANTTRSRELAVMDAVDHVVIVSDAELPLLREQLPDKPISVFPALYADIVENPAPFSERRDIFFLGGFEHRPNVEAVIWFVRNIWPQVRDALPEVTFSIIGSSAPKQISKLGELPGVKFHGYVADLLPEIGRFRVSVAPLRYGAGIKGKVAAAMGAGVATICTTIAAEGMHIIDGVHALVRDDEAAFAAAVIDAYRDEKLWNELSGAGRDLVKANFGNAANRASFCRVLSDARLLSPKRFIEYCEEDRPANCFAHARAEMVDVSIIIRASEESDWECLRACLNAVALTSPDALPRYEVLLASAGRADLAENAARHFPILREASASSTSSWPDGWSNVADQARGRYLLFLDSNIVMLPGCMAALFRVLENDGSAGAVGAKVLHRESAVQAAGGVIAADGGLRSFGAGMDRDDPSIGTPREVDHIPGGALLVRESAWTKARTSGPRFSHGGYQNADLCMAMRREGYRVLYEPSAEAVNVALEASPSDTGLELDSEAREDRVRFKSKWNDTLAREHASRWTDLGRAAARAERRPSPAAKARRMEGKLNILYFSPFPSHPASHGNQTTIQWFARQFQMLGHKVHFVLLESGLYGGDDLRDMKAAWDKFDLLPNTRELWATGDTISFDSWYEPGLGENVARLCRRYDIDIVFCSYVFQSKLLDYVPAHILKVIDTHDKMGDRFDMLGAQGLPLEFFSCTPEEEGKYLRRADIVVARRDEEAAYFDNVAGRRLSITIPHFEPPNFHMKPFSRLRSVGLVASANRINLAVTTDFLAALDKALGGRQCPFNVEIAGDVKRMVRDLAGEQAALFSRRWVHLRGFVDDIGAFYGDVDAVISPVTIGTGINVKTVQAMAHGMPLVATAWATKGIETDESWHAYADADALAAGLLRLVEMPGELERLAGVSRDRYTRFYNDALNALAELTRRVR